MDVLVTYDVQTTSRDGERRLHRVAKTCERYGQRVQMSVFECRLSPTRYERLVVDLRTIIDPGEDVLHIYKFAGALADARVSLGRGAERDPGKPWIL